MVSQSVPITKDMPTKHVYDDCLFQRIEWRKQRNTLCCIADWVISGIKIGNAILKRNAKQKSKLAQFHVVYASILW